MKRFIVAIVILFYFISPEQLYAQSGMHEFSIMNFKTEGNTILPKATIIYSTYGKLNGAKDNAILLPSHYMADYNGYGFLIGAGKSLDTTKYFLIATELFGNGRSSSPSNTPEPFHGPRFPLMTIRDNVNAVHALLTNELKINHLLAVIGFSMGAQQAFQWSVSYPTFSDKIVAINGTAKNYPHGFVRLEGQIAAITADNDFLNGDYITQPKKGLQAFSVVWSGWLYSQEWWRRELWKEKNPEKTTEQRIKDSYNLFNGLDANNLIAQARTWQYHDIGTTNGFDGNIEKALRFIQVPILYMPSMSDLYFPIGDAQYEASFNNKIILKPIPSLWGHVAGVGSNAKDNKFVNDNISAFLNGSIVKH
jgi:homoserine O-acetyltransferase